MASADDPQPFLKGTGVVSVNNTGAWATILNNEKLSVDSKPDENIKLNSVDDGLGVLKFTSDQNALYFGTLDSASTSNAATGDSFGCMYDHCIDQLASS
jgi:hypothetical protein